MGGADGGGGCASGEGHAVDQAGIDGLPVVWAYDDFGLTLGMLALDEGQVDHLFEAADDGEEGGD